MNVRLLIHCLAVLSLLMVAIQGIIGSMHQAYGASIGTRLAPFFGLAVWAWLIWKIWKRPRKWGLGVGILLFLMIVFQTYLWNKALAGPLPEQLGGVT